MELTTGQKTKKIAAELGERLAAKHLRTIQRVSNHNLAEVEEYNQHAQMIAELGRNYCSLENREFEIDERNKDVLRFLLYYFNGSELCEQVFPDEDYKLNKNILLVGGYGTGKTLIMQIFADYCRLTQNPLSFKNISQTQLLNCQKTNSNINFYTFNETAENKFKGEPFHVCLNDIGIDTQQKSYGTDLNEVIDEFLFARYELYQQKGIRFHLTSNCDLNEFKQKFEDRIIDRLKCFNVVVLDGESRRK